MTDTTPTPRHPANAIFALMEDRDFRFPIIKKALETNKSGICRHATGKHQMHGFRNIAKAPIVMLIPVISEEANVSPLMAKEILTIWLADQTELRTIVSEKLGSLGYEVKTEVFDADNNVDWNFLKKEDAEAQFDGTFIPDQEKNGVMLMSLLLGWFGSDDETEEEAETEAETEA